MDRSIFTVNLAEMLLMTVDSHTLRQLYEKAPKKKMPSFSKSIPTQIRTKVIANLLDRGNSTYTLSQISEGRLDHFYHVSNTTGELKTYSELRTLVEDHREEAGQILLTLFKSQDSKKIEAYFDSDVDKIDALHEDWRGIKWGATCSNNDKLQQSLNEKRLKLDILKLQKANARLKERFEHVNDEKKQENQAFRVGLDEQSKKFQMELAQQKSVDYEEKKRAVKKIKSEYEDKIKSLDKWNDLRVKKMNSEITNLNNQLIIEKSVMEEYVSVITDMRKICKQDIIIVAYQAPEKPIENGYIFVGEQESIDQLIEWIQLIKPERLILVQETTSREFWLSLKTELSNRNISTNVEFSTKWDLFNGGKYK